MIKAIVRPERPGEDVLRARQLMANIAREGFKPAKTLSGLLNLQRLLKEKGRPKTSAKDLIREVGMKQATAYRWWKILNARESEQAALAAGEQTVLEIASAASTEQKSAHPTAAAKPKPKRRGKAKKALILKLDAKGAALLLKKTNPEASVTNWEDIEELQAHVDERVVTQRFKGQM